MKDEKMKNDLGADAAAGVSAGSIERAAASHVAHTPGPWCVHPRFRDVVIIASDVHKRIGGASDPDREAEGWAKQICRAEHTEYSDFHRSRVVSKTERDANAHLIAAAPELLEVARIVASASMSGTKGRDESWIGWQWSQGGSATAQRVKDLARAAIAKAEGKQIGTGNQASNASSGPLRSEAP